MRLRVLAALGLVLGCVPPSQRPVELALELAGGENPGPIASVGGVRVELEQSQLAFGPLYFCAGNSAGELCEVARLEWMGASVVDLLSAQPVQVGTLVGSTGPLRSWMYDLGVVSTLTATTPVVLDAAKALGGASLRVRGSLAWQGRRLPFETAVTVAQEATGELGVPVIRKGASEPFAHDLQGDERALRITFSSSKWFAKTDFRGYFAEEACRAQGPELTCAGDVEQRCSAQGQVLGTRDCQALGQVCAAEQGCTPRLQVLPKTLAYRGLRLALSTDASPRFEFLTP